MNRAAHDRQSAVHTEMTSRLVDLNARNFQNIGVVWKLDGYGMVTIDKGLQSSPPSEDTLVILSAGRHAKGLIGCHASAGDTLDAPPPLTGMQTVRLTYQGGGTSVLPAEMTLLLEPMLTLISLPAVCSLYFTVPFQNDPWCQAAAQYMLAPWSDVFGRNGPLEGDLHLTLTLNAGQATVSEMVFLNDEEMNYRQCRFGPDLARELQKTTHVVNRNYVQNVLPRLNGISAHP